MIQAPSLAGLDGIRHRFFTRRGGVSSGLYSSLNCGYGSGDSPDNVRENRRRVAETFGRTEPDLLTLYQIHSTEVLTIDSERWLSPGAPKADGLVTEAAGGRAGRDGGRLRTGAAGRPHGRRDRRSACRLEGRAERRRRGDGRGDGEARARGARTCAAAIGPCIGRDSYEVGPEFPVRFLEQDEANAAFFRPAARAGHSMFDLAGYLVHRIGKAGVAVEATAPRHAGGDGGFLQLSPQHAAGRAGLRTRPLGDRARGVSALFLVPRRLPVPRDDRDMRHVLTALACLLLLAGCVPTPKPFEHDSVDDEPFRPKQDKAEVAIATPANMPDDMARARRRRARDRAAVLQHRRRRAAGPGTARHRQRDEHARRRVRHRHRDRDRMVPAGQGQRRRGPGGQQDRGAGERLRRGERQAGVAHRPAGRATRRHADGQAAGRTRRARRARSPPASTIRRPTKHRLCRPPRPRPARRRQRRPLRRSRPPRRARSR